VDGLGTISAPAAAAALHFYQRSLAGGQELRRTA
jgi:hypothetical protein